MNITETDLCMPSQSLNIALIVNNSFVPEWQYQLVQRILRLRRIHLKMVVVAAGVPETFIARLLRRSLNLLKAIDRLGLASPGDPTHLRSLATLCHKQVFHNLGEDGLEAIYADRSIDVILAPDQYAGLPEWLFRHCRYGVWRLFSGSANTVLNEWTGVGEYVAGEKQIYAGISAQKSSDAKVTNYIFLTSNSINRTFFHRSLEPMLWKMAGILPRLLQQVRDSDDRELMLVGRHKRYASRSRALALGWRHRTKPGLPLLMSFFSTMLAGKWTALQRKILKKEKWTLLYGVYNESVGLQLENLQALTPSAGKHWADPQLVQHQQRHFIFLEEWVDQDNKGRIVCMEWQKGDRFSAAIPVLEEKFHLSYPQVFQFADQYYMVPESAENKNIALYRCTRFPDRWEFVHNLLEGVEAYDATLHEYQGCWWMFVNIRVHPYSSSDDLLYLYSAKSPLSREWISHPCNPIVSEVSSARSAGKIIQFDNNFYRPSQNCAGSYGRGLNLNQIVQWNNEQYQERTLHRYLPDGESGLFGIHTLSVFGDKVLSDGIIKV